MAHSNLNKLPAGPANEGMQVEAAEDQNPPPVLSAAEGTPTRFPIPGAPQLLMGQMPPPPPPPPDLCWHDIIHALATMPPLYPGVTLHPYTRRNLPGWPALEIHDASISGWIDLCCSALYNISIEEYNTRLAVQMLHSHILHVLATITQQAALEYHAETANVAEGADGTVVEAGIADAILQLEDRETLRPHEDGPNNNGNE
ncbi:unnamed protein product [Sphagnum troendelagicum]|uniref:Uncharacterized protein n=1 Tax=Sphagnum troendelagicum TaxID=128251 RepID=A0ABP0U6Z9_9BRYO